MKNPETIIANRSELDQNNRDAETARLDLAQTAIKQFQLMEHAQRQAEAHIKENGRLLSLFAKDSTLHFEPSSSAETFAFYPEENKVELPMSWFENNQYTDVELRWAQYHELAHFIDMRKNPEAFLQNFKDIEQTANQLAKSYQDKFPDAELESMKHYFYEQIHCLYNCLDDIYVNNLVGIKASYYYSGEGAYDVTNLYRKVGFAEPNLSKLPAHLQFAYSLLRDEMVGQQLGLSQISEEVEEALSKKRLGRSIRDLVNQELKPKPGLLVDPENRYKLIQTFIEPAYIQLLKDGLDKKQLENNSQDQSSEEQQSQSNRQSQESQTSDQQDQQSGQTDQSQGEQSSEQQDQQSNQTNQSDTTSQSSTADSESSSQSQNSDFDPFNQGSNRRQNFLDSADESTIQQILDAMHEQDKVQDMSPQERNQYDIEQQKLKFDREYQITPEMRQEYDKIVNSVSAMRQEMRQFWKNLIGKSIEYQQVITNQQRKGRLNVRDFINQYPQVVASERSGNLNNNAIYDRQQLEKVAIEKPESIEISLLIDTSSSMDNPLKLRIAKETAVLLMLSIKDFNAYLDQTRRETNSRLRANTQIITYNSSFEEVKPFEKRTNYLDNEANIIKTISKVVPCGGTDDATPLAFIRQGITAEQLTKIKQQKLKKIVFVITDGSPNNPNASAQAIIDLTNSGVLTFGFQIGNVNKGEEETFNYVWNRQQSSPLGIVIGGDLRQLPKRLTDILTNTMKGIRL